MSYGNDVPDSFYTAVLAGIGAPATPKNLQWLKNWHAAEGSAAHYNPFNTTRHENGSTDLGGPTGNNNHPVQIFANTQDGLTATIATLNQSQYVGIRNGLAANDQLAASYALVSSPWGTHKVKDPESGQTITGTGVPGSGAAQKGGPDLLHQVIDAPGNAVKSVVGSATSGLSADVAAIASKAGYALLVAGGAGLIGVGMLALFAMLFVGSGAGAQALGAVTKVAGPTGKLASAAITRTGPKPKVAP